MVEPAVRDLERAVRGVVAEGSLLPSSRVRPGNSGGPAATELYATVLAITDATDALPWTTYTPADGDQLDARIGMVVRASYSVQWYLEGARDAARRCRLWLRSELGQEAVADVGLVLGRIGPVRQLDEIVSDEWEERAGFDLAVQYLQTLSAQVPALREVEIGTEIVVESDTIRETIDVREVSHVT